jgi:hypothetical protein
VIIRGLTVIFLFAMALGAAFFIAGAMDSGKEDTQEDHGWFGR